ncbi:MAG: TlyA family RNA methyltransferase [Tissierellia bacterium]|nr:TlyA family RNA methyltransferase [Tissierellia bacterium]
MTKIRADVLLVKKGLISSREKAKRIIMEGNAFIGTQRIDKPGDLIEESEPLYVKDNSLEFVSRGGYKLKKIIDRYHIDLKDKICIDIGASTGGFTDCMLQYHAKKIYAIDVGYNQLDYRLRMDDRVISMERTNIRHFDPSIITDKINFITIDVSFISLELVLPKARELLHENGHLVALIKPQFEAGKGKVGKGGIVKDRRVHYEVLEKIFRLAKSLDFQVIDLTHSPITGTTGNIEFLIYLTLQEIEEEPKDLKTIVDIAHQELLKR